MIKKFEVELTQTIEIEIDLDKFTQKVRDDFEAVMFKAPNLEDHARFIGEQIAKGAIRSADQCLEGYGTLKGVGVGIGEIDEYSHVWRKLQATECPPTKLPRVSKTEISTADQAETTFNYKIAEPTPMIKGDTDED